jgi:hypothetical protein
MQPRLFLRFVLALPLVYAVPDICVDASTAVRFDPAQFTKPFTTSDIPCYEIGNFVPFRSAGGNIFNLLWDAWMPTTYPHPEHGGNVSTSLKSLGDYAAQNLTFYRTFASPWGASDIQSLWLDGDRTSFWETMDVFMKLSTELHVFVSPSILIQYEQWALALNVSLRTLVVDIGGDAQQVLKEYTQEMVTRYVDEPSVLMWGFGNELNLMVDGCTYDKSAGAYFSTNEMMAFAREFTSWVREIDAIRPINSDFSHPRTRASALAASEAGCSGEACVSEGNPNGDCELEPSPYPKDSADEYKTMLALYSEPFDMVGIHAYGCYPPYDNFSFCSSEAGLDYITASQEVAAAQGKPLFIGEFGSEAGSGGEDPGTNTAGWSTFDGSEARFDFPLGLLEMQATSSPGIALTNLWSFCSTKDSDDWCVDSLVDSGDTFIVDRMQNTTLAALLLP